MVFKGLRIEVLGWTNLIIIKSVILLDNQKRKSKKIILEKEILKNKEKWKRILVG